MATPLVPPPSLRSGASWVGRASHHRRHQVRSRRPQSLGGVQALWESLVEVLRAIDGPSSALLCTADGAPVATYGLPKTEVPRVSFETGSVFAARTPPLDLQDSSPGEVETVELSADQRHTVIAWVPGPPQGHHLLSVTAEGVSLPVLHAWTRQAAEDLGELLASQP